MNAEVPRYEMRRLVATGGMGKVWAAHDSVLDREVALKVLKDEFADDRLFRDRFAAEARHAARLQHPNVATVLDYGELPTSEEHPTPRPYLVMELVDGEPLSALLRDGQPMPAETAADIVGQAATGISAAHRAGIVHRDVKPGNLLVTPEGVVKVTDFGIARAADAVPLTATGHVMGTPHYLSPEQAEGKTATAASDVYGLGIVLFECLTGRRPFAGDSPIVTALQHVNDPLPPLPDEVPAWLRSVVQRATAKDPDERYPDAGEMAAAIKDQQPETGTPTGPATRLLAAASPPAAPAAARTTRVAEEAPAKQRSRRPWGAILGGLVALVVAALLVWGLLGADEGEPDPGAQLVQVDADDYIGEPYDDAADALDDAGLVPTREERSNPGGEEPDEVADVRPTGNVEDGSTVVLTVWGPEPQPTPQPTKEPAPEPTQEPSEEPTEESTPATTPTEETPADDGNGGNGEGGILDGGQE